MDTLSREEFRELARSGKIRLSHERNEHEILNYLTHERGWVQFPIFTLRQDATPTDPGWVEIEADFDKTRVTVPGA